MQIGCCACEDIIHVSAQPVTPSEGVVDATGTFPSETSRFWLTGHAVPMSMSPDSKPSISSEYRAHGLLTMPACCFKRFTAASNWSCESSYGSVILRAG